MPTSKTYDGSADTGGSPLALELPLLFLFSVDGSGVEVEAEEELDGGEPDLGNM
jgi:hypothetical protein